MPEPGVETPICTSALVCEQIIQDRATGKLSLIGVFNRLAAESLPHREHLAVFFSLTNGRGAVEIRLQIEQDDGEPLVQIRGTHTIPNPLTILDHGVQLRNVAFKKAGRHWATVWCGEELLNRRPFDVVVAPAPPNAGPIPPGSEAV
ncbi:MAG: hypothetical protein D6693_02115 [Planctomycetota bacterium]|nr:MAG: hypothetical protein D6693_02115 [Planctomycetota bacterium]